MNIVRPLRIIATIAALVAVALGIGTYTHPDFTDIHMVSGLIVALTLLIMAALALFSKGLQALGAIGIVLAFFVPIFGYWQQMILAGNLHWLVETAHLAVGFGALALIGAIGERLARRKRAAGAISPSRDAA